MSPFDADQRTFDRQFAEIIDDFDGDLGPKPAAFLWILAADVIALALFAWAVTALIGWLS